MKRVLVFFIFSGAVIAIVGFRTAGNRLSEISAPPTSKSNATAARSKTFDSSKYSTTDPASIWIVVNKNYPLQHITHVPANLKAVGNGQLMDKRAAVALKQMIAAGVKQGVFLSALSGYRSYQTQVTVYANEVKRFGQAVADSESAKPGYSEHQTGFAVDLGGGGCGIEDCFGKTKEGKWVAANAYKYGFIVRYTANKQAVTGYRAEPWHIRFIGEELSLEMHRVGITTLEEFFNL